MITPAKEKIRLKYFKPRGLSTSRVAAGSPDALAVCEDARGNRGVMERRRGMVRVAYLATTATCTTFDGVDDEIALASGALALGTTFTVEALFQTTNVSSTRFILGRSSSGVAVAFTISHTNSSTVVVVVTFSDSSTATLTFTSVSAGTLCALQVVRNGSLLTGRLNGSTQTATVSSTLSLIATGVHTLGSDNAGSRYLGPVDFVRAFDTARADQRDGWCRLLNPRAPDVKLDLVTGLTNSLAWDRSRYGNHGLATGTPASATSIATNPMPVQCIAPNTRRSGSREVIVVAGGRIYPVTVT